MIQGQNLLYKLVGDSVAIAVVMASGLPDKLQGSNVIYNGAVTGLAFTVADDAYNYFSGQGSMIANGQYVPFANKVLNFGAVFTVANATGADARIANLVTDISPLPPAITQDVALGAMIVTADVLRNYLATSSNVMVQNLVNPLNLVGIHQ